MGYKRLQPRPWPMAQDETQRQPQSPDINGIERFWLEIKNQYFTYFVAKVHEELSRHLEKALKYYIDRPEICRRICGAKK